MRYNHLPTLPIAPSALTLGVADFGTTVPTDLAYALMDQYYEAGGNFFDTAHIYAAWLKDGWGTSERTLGAWAKQRHLRSKINICTKGAHPPLGQSIARLAPEDIRQDLHESLQRLGTHYIDLYLLHRDNPAVPVLEILQTLEDLKTKGLIRLYGCSNWSVPRQQEATETAKKHRLSGFALSQIGFSLAQSNLPDTTGVLYMDAPTQTYHTQTKTPLMAFSSQANGFFSGNYTRQHPNGPNNNRPHVGARYATETNFRRLEAAQTLATKHHTTPNQIALAYLLHQPYPCYPIIGPKNPTQLTDSLAATTHTLTPEDLHTLT